MASLTSVKTLGTPTGGSFVVPKNLPTVASIGARDDQRRTTQVGTNSNVHSGIMLPTKTENAYQCKVCGKFVATEQGLKSHSTRLHKEATAPHSNRTPVLIPVFLAVQSQPVTFNPTSFLQMLAARKLTLKLVRRLPKAARAAAAFALADTIDHCVRNNSVSDWERLLLFPSACFGLPSTPHPNRSTSLTNLITRNVNAFRLAQPLPFVLQPQPPTSLPHTASPRSQTVSPTLIESKIAEGDIKGAIRILCSESHLAPFDTDTLEKLRILHPETSLQVPEEVGSLSGRQVAPSPPLVITPSAIKSTIASFPTGSAGGPDLLLPQHLKDLTGHSAGAAGVRLLSSLADICTLMLSGRVPEAICPVLFGASLCALSKKGGGVRPIAVGCVLRRLAAKLGSYHVSSKLGTLLQPSQFGFGVKGGAEAVAHAARRYVDFQHLSPKVILKIDFANAFNSVDRICLLREAEQHIPELTPFLKQCYGQPSLLAFGNDTIASSRGIQQGDPLGPALFCLVVRPISSGLRSELNLWFLDDATMGGPLEDVLNDFMYISQEAMKIGLSLNVSKCELLVLGANPTSSSSIVEQIPPSAAAIRFPPQEDWTLLGAPLTEAAMVKCMHSKVSDLARMVDRLENISAHYSFYLLKNALAIPKLLYTIRCSPTWKAEIALQTYDTTLFQAVQKITNISFSEDMINQAALPVCEGGLGLRKATLLATPAFLASVESVKTLVDTILPANIAMSPDSSWEDGIQIWSSHTKLPLPPQDSRSSQGSWEKGYISLSKTSLQESATTLSDKARLLGVMTREAGAFLQAIPSPQLGTFLEDNVFRISLSLRLGADICEPHSCPCGVLVDRKGLHGLSCKRSPGRSSRHAAINDLIKRALSSAGFPSTLEPQCLDPSTRLRPDGVTLIPWSGGKTLAWDSTCVDAQAPSYLDSSAGIQRYAANRAEVGKYTKYEPIARAHVFSPIAVECLGAFGKVSLKLMKTIGQKLITITGDKRASEFLFQRLSVAVQRGNAASILGCLPRDVSMDDVLSVL